MSKLDNKRKAKIIPKAGKAKAFQKVLKSRPVKVIRGFRRGG